MRRDGTEFPMMVATSAITTDTDAPTLSGIIRDLSEQKRFEAQLAHQVLHDSLTGLAEPHDAHRPARAGARPRPAQRSHVRGVVRRPRPLQVGQRHARPQRRRPAARRSREPDPRRRCARPTPSPGSVATSSSCCAKTSRACTTRPTVAERIIAALQAPFRFGDDDAACQREHRHRAVPADGTRDRATTILANADIAMYRAKENGRNRYELFDEAMQQWVTDPGRARGRAAPGGSPATSCGSYCQPFIAADTGMIRGFEALVRWERPGFGLVDARRVHPRRRGDRADRRDRRLGARRGVPARRGVGAALAGASASASR